jgi:hypothetical protein
MGEMIAGGLMPSDNFISSTACHHQANLVATLQIISLEARPLGLHFLPACCEAVDGRVARPFGGPMSARAIQTKVGHRQMQRVFSGQICYGRGLRDIFCKIIAVF